MIELAPGVLLDESMHRPVADWALEQEGRPLFEEVPTLGDLLVMADLLIAGLSLITPEEQSELVSIVASDMDALSRLVGTPGQAQSWASAIWGQHRCYGALTARCSFSCPVALAWSDTRS